MASGARYARVVDTRVSSRLEAKVRADFEPGAVEPILVRLAEIRSERVQAAVVLLADGRWPEFERQSALAKVDFRDVLVAAGLADGQWSERLNERLGPRAEQTG
jgi:hypothetical protein